MRKLLWILVLFVIPWSEESSIFGGDSKPLYGPDDQVYILNVTTIKDHIYASSKAWVVEFFSSWCGHCIHFAPKWKQFATDLAPWNNVLVIAGIDCADDNNVPACRDFEVMGYPSIRYFPPHAAMNQTVIRDKKQTQDLYRGEAVEKSENLADMKRKIVDLMMPHVHSYHELDPNSSTVISDPDSLWQFIRKKTTVPEELPSFALVVFEAESASVSKEVAMTFTKFRSLTVVRFTKTNPLYSFLKLEGWPAAGYVKRDKTVGRIDVGRNTNVLESLVKQVVEIEKLPMHVLTSTENVKEQIKSEIKVVNEDAVPILEEPITNIVSTEDLLHAVRNVLKNEVGLFKEISGPKLQTLKNFLHVVAEFFPSDRRETTLFLLKLNAWLDPLDRVMDVQWQDKITELEVELHPFDIDINTWGNCKGSVPGRRGYTCSLWSLFHSLTVMAYEKKQDFPILDAIHGYMKEFFGCRECYNHFTQMVADDGALMIKPIKDQVLWLWKAHNKVNDRLKGALSEDPRFPKVQFPSETQCKECHNEQDDSDDEKSFNEVKVLEHLVRVYSKPERTLQSVHLNAERIYGTGSKSKPRTHSGFFSGFDFWLLCFVYLSVAVLLVGAYVHFRVKRGRMVDIYPYIFCRKLKHLGSGKWNV